MRFGELAGLQVRDVDFEKYRIRVARNAVWIDGETVVGTPKTEQVRSITAPAFVFDMLREQCARKNQWRGFFVDKRTN
ncbi:hypothetical protein CGERO_08435 [Corynebacterium gerontici]|uniref:Tyr recombinase domain-containing protein n=1 Tax=Corynebacterium gerontici TaxID=2079234 RepID=A0A3G6J1Z2_9CORY|nr:hypothetical protein CGERO_08435 [Corynebacterium gerontici]